MSRETSRGRASVRQLCQVFHISRQAYYVATRDPGPERGSRPRRERLGPWATASELEERIQRIVDGHPAWGVRKVWAVLRRGKVIASRKRVYAVMKKLGLLLPPARERDLNAPRGQVVAAESNRRWATDLTTTWTKRDGIVALVPVIDCGDRCVFECGVSKSQESPALLGPVLRSMRAEFGRPSSIPDGFELRTDHGPQYTGADCEELCRDWRIDHTFAPVGRPTGNAVAERFIQTLKIELLWTRDWESMDELREAVSEWLREYNFDRPHQALDWQTPAERRARSLGLPELAVA
jgi:putative transposase